MIRALSTFPSTSTCASTLTIPSIPRRRASSLYNAGVNESRITGGFIRRSGLVTRFAVRIGRDDSSISLALDLGSDTRTAESGSAKINVAITILTVVLRVTAPRLVVEFKRAANLRSRGDCRTTARAGYQARL